MFVVQLMPYHWCVSYFGLILFHIEWSSWLHWTHFYLSESLESLCVDCMLCLTFESINAEPCQYFIIVENILNKRYHKGLTFIYAPLPFNTWKMFVDYMTKLGAHFSGVHLFLTSGSELLEMLKVCLFCLHCLPSTSAKWSLPCWQGHLTDSNRFCIGPDEIPFTNQETQEPIWREKLNPPSLRTEVTWRPDATQIETHSLLSIRPNSKSRKEKQKVGEKKGKKDINEEKEARRWQGVLSRWQ